jgi:hypothetical protein
MDELTRKQIHAGFAIDMQKWLDWNESELQKRAIPVSDETLIWDIPSPVSRKTIKIWIGALNAK